MNQKKKLRKTLRKSLRHLVEKITKSLGGKIKEVKVTHRLTDSPACLVVGENDISGNLERILKAAGQIRQILSLYLRLTLNMP